MAKTLGEIRVAVDVLRKTRQYIIDENQSSVPMSSVCTKTVDFLDARLRKLNNELNELVGPYCKNVVPQYSQGLISLEEFISAMQWAAMQENSAGGS